MYDRTPMTPEQLRNNYQYKVVRRAIMEKFPWITDIMFDENDLNQYYTIFLDFVVDPDKVKELTDLSFARYVANRIDKGYYYKALYPSLLFDLSYEQGKNTITDPMEDLMVKIHDSPALPDELKLPSGRSFKPSSFIVNPDGPEY
jgi:hypothetical protein